MKIVDGVIIYRAHRLRFIVAALILGPATALMLWLAYYGIVHRDIDVRGVLIAILVGPIYVWLDWGIFAKLIRPPEMDISLKGVRWSNYAMLERPTDYLWKELEGPEPATGGYGVPLLQFVVTSTGRKLRLPPGHFGATYDEMAAVISAARGGRLISPEQWRSQHPQHPFRHWLIDWGLPLLLGGIISIALAPFDGRTVIPRLQKRCYNEEHHYSPEDERSACKQLLTRSSEAIQRQPNDANAYFNRGYAYEHFGDLHHAIQDFSQVIRISPERPDAYYYRWAAYKDSGDQHGAEMDFQTLSRLDPKLAAEIRSGR